MEIKEQFIETKRQPLETKERFEKTEEQFEVRVQEIEKRLVIQNNQEKRLVIQHNQSGECIENKIRNSNNKGVIKVTTFEKTTSNFRSGII